MKTHRSLGKVPFKSKAKQFVSLKGKERKVRQFAARTDKFGGRGKWEAQVMLKNVVYVKKCIKNASGQQTVLTHSKKKMQGWLMGQDGTVIVVGQDRTVIVLGQDRSRQW